SLSAELERLLAEGSQGATSTDEGEKEVDVQEQALVEAEAAEQAAVAEKSEADESARKRRDVVKEAEAQLNSIRSELSAARARVEVLEQTLQPASGTAMAAIHEHAPQDVSEILTIEPGWETAIAALLAGSTDRAWLDSLEAGITAVETLQNHDVADIRIFYPSQAQWDPLVISDVRLANSVISPRLSETAAFKHFASLLQTAVLVEELQDAQKFLARSQASNTTSIRIATRAGHVLSSSWLDFHGDGSTSSLERRAEYDRAVAERQRFSAAYG